MRGPNARARERYLISPAQETYLRRLLKEAFSKLIPPPFGLDAHHLERVTRETAGAAIDRLKALLAEHRARQAGAFSRAVEISVQPLSSGRWYWFVLERGMRDTPSGCQCEWTRTVAQGIADTEAAAQSAAAAAK